MELHQYKTFIRKIFFSKRPSISAESASFCYTEVETSKIGEEGGGWLGKSIMTEESGWSGDGISEKVGTEVIWQRFARER